MLTPEQAWLRAAEWGSYIRSGDPGACMYGFYKDGTVQSEAHRQACLAWINQHLHNPSMLLNTDDARELDELREYIVSAPMRGEHGNHR